MKLYNGVQIICISYEYFITEYKHFLKIAVEH